MSPFPENGLLPRADEDLEWLRPEGEADADPVDDAVKWMMNIGEANHIVWPAEIDGELRAPPPAHVLDALVRRDFSGSSSADAETELHLHPRAGTIGILLELPACDLCGLAEARYDGPFNREARGGWAYMCGDCYRAHSTLRLGEGEAQYLMTHEEVPAEVRDAYDVAKRYWSNLTRVVPGE